MKNKNITFRKLKKIIKDLRDTKDYGEDEKYDEWDNGWDSSIDTLEEYLELENTRYIALKGKKRNERKIARRYSKDKHSEQGDKHATSN